MADEQIVPGSNGQTAVQEMPKVDAVDKLSDLTTWDMFQSPQGILDFSLLMVAEFAALVFIGVAAHLLIRVLVSRIRSLSESEIVNKRCDAIQKHSRLLFTIIVTLVISGIACFNVWMVYQGKNAYEETYALISNIPASAWMEIGKAFLCIMAAIIGARIVNNIITRIAEALEAKAKSWEGLKANDESLSTFFNGITNILTNVVWIFVVIFTFQQLRLPQFFTDTLYTIATIYLIIAIGLSIVRITSVIVDTLDGLSQRYAEKKSWHQYYATLKPLVPLFRKCLEYVLWIGVGILVMKQLHLPKDMADFGQNLIEAIGIFFIARVVIELGYLFINKQVMGTKKLDDMERRRRETILPLVKSIFKNACYFTCFVLMLRAMGFDPMPFLAGAGILGVVVGLGAQPLINDVVSGFFIILEHIYLVGDLVEGGGAYGVVERIDFRTTKVRDMEGRVHIIRNGDMRQIINYSKEYMYSVVDVEIHYDESAQETMEVLKEIGQQLNQEMEEVLEPTEIFGILSLNQSDVTIRTKTKVKSGTHAMVAAELRLRIKNTFADRGIKPPIERKEIEILSGPMSGLSPA